jgi:hypothetical protein
MEDREKVSSSSSTVLAIENNVFETAAIIGKRVVGSAHPPVRPEPHVPTEEAG